MAMIQGNEPLQWPAVTCPNGDPPNPECELEQRGPANQAIRARKATFYADVTKVMNDTNLTEREKEHSIHQLAILYAQDINSILADYVTTVQENCCG